MSDQPLLHAENLARHYPITRGLFSKPVLVKALDGVSFSLRAGKTLAVVGESGCGKSTLARLVTMIEEPTSGTLTIDGEDVATAGKATLKSMRGAVQIVFQDPYGSLNPRQRIGAILEEPLKINTSMSAQQRRQAAQDMMVRVGLRPEHYGRYPHMFSGGQRQRIAIARALMLHPKIIILDEPVSALDVSIQAQVLNLLADLQEEFNLAYMFISHDLSVVRHVADDIVVMYLGKVVERAGRDALFETPVHPYTRALLSATPRTDPKARQERIKLTGELPSPIDPPAGCPFHPRCFMAQERCAKEIPAPETVGENHIAACYFWRRE
ncbi:ABC transporter ATP-binding protein [Varunaivibrio sulfuroxidans]|uniref:Dipeptide transport system ATP-binding protein n=1 Tax=Varunaivibrio sulfuroxidans TaxID=1773489 RepID=A0A4R3JEA5_9PROT|nr:dipeptide ABC transporter ATP-binding protein [Varunaivibrio sulfuroxidans]TCS63426.1 dipeptide transport system ATP-binding protein [Varunaivibrio sulfuroxidans]WES30428.1 dipeptide ABC transporter ATP-binding protein [Varunaivibrio sulfuroxidans]